MASPGAAGGKLSAARMISPEGWEKMPEDEMRTQDSVMAALTLMYMANGGHDSRSKSSSKKSATIGDKHNMTFYGSSGPPPFKKFKNMNEVYAKGKKKVFDASASESEEEEDEEEEEEDVTWNEQLSDSGFCSDEDIDLKNPEKEISCVAQVNQEAIGAKLARQESFHSADAGVFVSIISFLWAVRIALMTPASEESSETNSSDGQKGKAASSSGSQRRRQQPSLTTEDVIRRVSATFGDAHLLEMKMPLNALVRAVLRIFSSTTPPPGVSNFLWQPLAEFEKSTKNWSWTGPVLSHSPGGDTDAINITTPEAWGLTGRMLNKLVESFAEWLKAAQCTFSKIASLPQPPVSLMRQPGTAERFRDTRNIKNSICTIRPRSQEVTAYFRKEEALRYLIPERAFAYTTVDGRKATVAPLRRCSGKPTRKTRDHFILKPNRPPAFTVLCLVRDAAARLPDGMGTRSDICSLVKDSQFVIEDTSEDQVKQVVSGALDRLHYELDPCVKFDKDTRLWIYLHGNRVEEDFAEDCTSSTKMRRKNMT